MLKAVLRRLRQFEKDVEAYEKLHPDVYVLPARRVEKQIMTAESESKTSINEITHNGQDEEIQRPAHALIDTLNDIPDNLLLEVSPQSKRLKYFIKVPMILIISTAAL